MEHEVETDEVAEGNTEVSCENTQLRPQSWCASGLTEKIDFAVSERSTTDSYEYKYIIIIRVKKKLFLCVGMYNAKRIGTLKIKRGEGKRKDISIVLSPLFVKGDSIVTH